MKILVKPTTTNLKKYKKNAEAFLFGIEKLSSYQTKIISVEELTKIVNKYKEYEIFVGIDKNLFNRDLPFLEETLKKLNKINIKGIFFYDLAVLYLAKKLNIKIPLIWNQNFLTTNYKTCQFYEKQNISGVNISAELTTDEIIEIKNNTKLTTFVNIFGYQLMAFSNRKLITNYFKHINKRNNKKNNYMIEKNKSYLIKENTSGTMMLSDYILNGYDELERLKNIDYIVLNEFMIKNNIFVKILKIFKDKISNNINNDVNKIIKNTSDGFFNKKTIYKVKK